MKHFDNSSSFICFYRIELWWNSTDRNCIFTTNRY